MINAELVSYQLKQGMQFISLDSHPIPTCYVLVFLLLLIIVFQLLIVTVKKNILNMDFDKIQCI